MQKTWEEGTDSSDRRGSIIYGIKEGEMTYLFESATDQVDLFSVPLELGDELFGP